MLEGPIKNENWGEINTLDENVKISFSIQQEAIQYLPKITSEEFKNKLEKYSVLLGETNIINGTEVQVSIKAVLNIDESDKVYYVNKREVIDMVDIAGIRRLITELQASIPEYKNYNFIGEIHTHPIQEGNIDEVSPTDPSEEDIASIIEEYESGNLNSASPFIFAIAGLNLKGETVYSFYRIVKNEKAYKCLSL